MMTSDTKATPSTSTTLGLGQWQRIAPAALRQAMRDHPEALSGLLITHLRLQWLAGQNLQHLQDLEGQERSSMAAALVFLLMRGELEQSTLERLMAPGLTWVWLGDPQSVERLLDQQYEDDPLDAALALIGGMHFDQCPHSAVTTETAASLALNAHALLRREAFRPAEVYRQVLAVCGPHQDSDEHHPLMLWLREVGQPGQCQLSPEELEQALAEAYGLMEARALHAHMDQAARNAPALPEDDGRVQAPLALSFATAPALAEWMATFPAGATSLAEAATIWEARMDRLEYDPSLSPLARPVARAVLEEALQACMPFGALAAYLGTDDRWRPEPEERIVERVKRASTPEALQALETEVRALERAIEALSPKLRKAARERFIGVTSLEQSAEVLRNRPDGGSLLIRLGAIALNLDDYLDDYLDEVMTEHVADVLQGQRPQPPVLLN